MLLPMLFLIACGEDKIDPGVSVGYIEPEIAPYLDNFIYEANLRGYTYFQPLLSKLTVVFKEDFPRIDDSMLYGVCYNSQVLILIKKTEWDKMDHYKKERAIFHELGHCLLGKKHSEDLIMNPYLLNLKDNEYQNNRNKHLYYFFMN